VASSLLTPQPMLAATIPAYPYKQYADDDDIQAFFAAYNAATQTYVDWFNSVNLPFYPGLTGDLLDWVATGLYGLPRTNLAQSTFGALGPLDTEALNTAALNSFTPPSVTYYTLTDDIFKRILTWNFYKGDGKRFSMLWLKRRIMRFLLGANGLDPNPLSSSFVIGPENTQAIGVQVASHVLTVAINEPYISSLVQLAPGIINIFSAAFTGGVLDLPLQYTYATQIVTHLTATVNPLTESTVGIATTLTTGAADVSVYGGSGAYTYAWTWASGGTGITTNSPSASSTSWTASGMTRGTTLTGVALCTVTDTSTLQTTTVTVSVSIQNVSAPGVTLSPTSLSVTGASATESTGTVTATIVGGQAPYSMHYTWQTGGAGMTIDSPTAAATTVTATGLTPGQTDTGTLLFTATDFYGQNATATCPVSIGRVTSLGVSVSPGSLSVSSSVVPMTTGTATVTASGGQPPYSYAWSFVWTSNTDGATESTNSPTSAATSFTASGMSPGNTDTGNGQCVVTDAFGQTAIVNVSVSFTYLPPVLRSYTSGSGSDTVPAGYSTVVIEVWGGGGGGQEGFLGTGVGAGGGAAGYSRSQYSCTGGQTIDYSIGTGGTGGTSGDGAPGTNGNASTASSGSLGIITMTANGGIGGTSSGGGAGGTASGGNQANTTGGAGSASRTGGLAANGVYANNPASNGDGGRGGGSSGTVVGSNGSAGLVTFRYS
jgi:hypothetical protein